MRTLIESPTFPSSSPSPRTPRCSPPRSSEKGSAGAPIQAAFSFSFGCPLPWVIRLRRSVVDIEAPCAGAAAVALECRNQANVRKSHLGLVPLPRDVKDNLGAVPFVLVFDKIQMRIGHVPYDALPRHQLRDLLCAAVNILVPVRKHLAQFVGVPVDFSRPPPANIVDGVEDFFGDRSTSKVVVKFSVFIACSPLLFRHYALLDGLTVKSPCCRLTQLQSESRACPRPACERVRASSSSPCPSRLGAHLK